MPVLVFAMAMGALSAVAHAQPQVPSTFWGSVTIDGEAAPEGTEIRALVDGIDCTQAAPGERPAVSEGNATFYVVHVVHEGQRPGCGREGKTVSFTINGVPAKQQGTWTFGPQQLDLSSGGGDVVPLPTPTPTVPGSSPETPLPSVTGTLTTTPGTTGTAAAGETRPPAAPSPSGTATGGAGAPSSDGGDGASSAWIPIAVVLGLITIGGVAAGIGLSRRRRPPAPPGNSA